MCLQNMQERVEFWAVQGQQGRSLLPGQLVLPGDGDGDGAGVRSTCCHTEEESGLALRSLGINCRLNRLLNQWHGAPCV